MSCVRLAEEDSFFTELAMLGFLVMEKQVSEWCCLGQPVTSWLRVKALVILLLIYDGWIKFRRVQLLNTVTFIGLGLGWSGRMALRSTPVLPQTGGSITTVSVALRS